MARRVARAGGVGVARFDYAGVLWLKYVFMGMGQHSSIGGDSRRAVRLRGRFVT